MSPGPGRTVNEYWTRSLEFTSPNITVQFADENRIVTLSFEAEIVTGELGLSDETTAYGYFPVDELDAIDLWHTIGN